MSMETKYKESSSGTFYKKETPLPLVFVLERLRVSQERIILEYGDIKTGESWGETCDITGRIGRSTGPIKVPILIYNKRSTGGGEILTDCILSICSSKGKQLIYRRVIGDKLNYSVVKNE